MSELSMRLVYRQVCDMNAESSFETDRYMASPLVGISLTEVQECHIEVQGSKVKVGRGSDNLMRLHILRRGDFRNREPFARGGKWWLSVSVIV